MPGPDYSFQSYYRRRLPHLHSYDKPIFITWRMAFTFPATAITQISNELQSYRDSKEIKLVKNADLSSLIEKRRFALYDYMLAKDKSFPQLLNDTLVVEHVISSITFYDQERINLIAYCIMPNHVHLLLKPLEDTKGEKTSLANIMQSIKGYSALNINRALNRKGAFWQKEYYDHVIRDDIELARCLNYIVNNPVKAGIAKHWKDWQHTLIKAEYLKYLPAEYQ